MKKLSIFMFSLLATAAMISCDDDTEEVFTTQPMGDFSFRSNPAASYILTFETKDNLAERLLWNELEFSTPVAVTYEVQASTDATNFDNPVIVTSTSETSVALSVERLNEVGASVGLTPFTPGVIAMRVKASLADPSLDPEYTDVISLNVTTYTTESPRLWMPGNYAAASGYGADWSPGDADTPFIEAVEFGNTEFEGYVFLNVASPEFKLTIEQDWDEAYGDDSGSLSLTGGNITAPGPGYYRIRANTDPAVLSYSVDVASWAVIGAATPIGWGSDTDMTYNATSKKWEVTLLLSQDEFKFRANDDWGLNLGNDDDGDGSMNYDGGNLSVPSPGNYKIELDLSNPRAYTYTLTAI